MKLTCIAASLFVISSIASAQAPWPMERQDRWGSGVAKFGPDSSLLTTPWISNKLSTSWPVSHGAALGENGIGYFGNWVENKLFKFNYNSGAILGSFSALSFVTSVPALGPGNEVYFSTEEKLFSLDSSVMDFNWFRNHGYVGGSPILGPDGNILVATATGNVYRLHPQTSLPIWTKSGLGVARGACVFTRDDTKVIVSNGNSVTALNYSDGSVAWTTTFGAKAAGAASSQSGTIVVGDEDGFVYGLNPSNGSILWAKQVLDDVKSAPAFSPDGTVAYVNSLDHRLYAFRVSDGVKLWSFTGSYWNEYSPSVDFDGRIYFHNKVGDVYCVAPNGTQVWQAHLNGEPRGPLTIGPDGSLFVGYTGDQERGLAIIRQEAISLNNDGLQIVRGSLMDGGLAQLQASDDTYVKILQAFDGDRSDRPITAIVTATSSYNPLTRIKLKLEAKINSGGINQLIEIFNFSTGTWSPIDSREASQTDSTIDLDLNSANAFSSAEGQIKVRVSWKPSSAPGNRLTASIDNVHLDVVPLFHS